MADLAHYLEMRLDESLDFTGNYDLEWSYEDSDNPAETGWKCTATLTGGSVRFHAGGAFNAGISGGWPWRRVDLSLWQVEELFGAAEIMRMEIAAADAAMGAV
jgi:hypothetical protein